MNATVLEQLRLELEELELWPFLQDATVTDLRIAPSGQVILKTFDDRRDTGITVPPERIQSLVRLVAAVHGLVVGEDTPTLAAEFPFRAGRLQAVLPRIATAPTLTIRFPPPQLFTLADLVERDTLTQAMADDLADRFIEQRQTTVISGGTGSGKTTLATALLHEMLRRHPLEALVIIEDETRDILADGVNVTKLLTWRDGPQSMTELVRVALRLDPDRIVIGEVRGPEALDFIKAANTGLPGGLLTVHANSAEEALDRLDALAQEAGVPPQRGRVEAAVDQVVQMGRERRVVATKPSTPRSP
jgi:type IV secretion system protein TrbB